MPIIRSTWASASGGPAGSASPPPPSSTPISPPASSSTSALVAPSSRGAAPVGLSSCGTAARLRDASTPSPALSSTLATSAATSAATSGGSAGDSALATRRSTGGRGGAPVVGGPGSSSRRAAAGPARKSSSTSFTRPRRARTSWSSGAIDSTARRCPTKATSASFASTVAFLSASCFSACLRLASRCASFFAWISAARASLAGES
mmetsp:Transcript_84026/g.242919  ORF Transcript_84026/g.242919 Transcript_84026/m.242919 type:complete len:206 (+) Transcript_84026:355-972(+)